VERQPCQSEFHPSQSEFVSDLVVFGDVNGADLGASQVLRQTDCRHHPPIY
jgi:hypothetical protein